MKWQYRHTVLALCSLSFSSYHVARQSLPPAIPLIKAQMGLSYAQAGLVAGAYDLGYGATLMIGGYFADRINRTVFVSIGLLWLAFTLFLTTTADSFLTLCVYRILTGFAFGTYFSSGISLLSSYFPRQERGTALGIHTGMGAGLGKLMPPLVAGVILESLGWRPLFYVAVVPVLLTAIAFWRVVKEPDEKVNRGLPFGTVVREVMGSRTLILLGLNNAAVTAGMGTLYSFLPLYLVNVLGTSLAFGGYAVAILNGISIPMVSASGFLSDRLGRKRVILGTALGSAVFLYIFPHLRGDVQIVAGILLMGAFVGTSFSILITYLVDVTPATHRSTALGYVNTFAVTGGVVSPILAGYISDTLGLPYVFPFLALLSIASMVCIWPVREPRAREVVEG